ncbi:arginase family protein, partial [Candidatus Micrarchaeota archaeon]|nr:arginase family protein [Candidatus Micrarchaeota archaeon]
RLRSKIYASIDLDVFDPSFVSTGTPEPDGLSWRQVVDLLGLIAKEKEVIGFDMVELVPEQNADASSFFAAKLGYKFLSQIYVNRQENTF